MTIGKIYPALHAIQSAFAKEGIPKSNRNTQQNYSFRGIDDVLTALAPLLSEHRVLILPKVLGYTQSEGETKNGGAIYKMVAHLQYTFVHIDDGSTVSVELLGEGMDSGDKESNKAHSAAYKLMAIQTFCIPTTDGSTDSETQSHDNKPFSQRAPQQPRPQTQAPARAATPQCQHCGSDKTMKSKYGPGCYCLDCKASFNPEEDNAFAGGGADPDEDVIMQEAEIPF